LKSAWVITILVALMQSVAPAVRAEVHIAAGDRVRVATSEQDHEDEFEGSARRPLIGTVKEINARSLTLKIKGRDGPMVIPRSSVTRLELSLGTRDRAGSVARGAAVGFLAGAVLGGIVGMASHDDDESSSNALITFDHSRMLDTVLGAAIFGLGGLLVGGVVGGVAAGEDWEEISSPFGDYGVGILPHRQGGLALTLTWGF